MNEESINGEFAKKLTDLVGAFFALDEACDKVKEKQICDAVGVKCDLSCKLYVKKNKLLELIEESIRAEHTAPVREPSPIIPVEPVEEARPLQPEPEKTKERLCPSCGQKAARPGSKYCVFCG